MRTVIGVRPRAIPSTIQTASCDVVTVSVPTPVDFEALESAVTLRSPVADVGALAVADSPSESDVGFEMRAGLFADSVVTSCGDDDASRLGVECECQTAS